MQSDKTEIMVRKTEPFGFPREIIKDLEQNITDLLCPICHDIFNEPVTDICGHTFCLSCIQNHVLNSSWCPVSKKNQAKGSDFVVTFILKNMIMKKPCWCQNREKGCNWEGILENVSKHLQTTCKFELIKCQECEEIQSRANKVNHKTVCVYRISVCEFNADHVLPFKDIENHQKSCTDKPIACQKSCPNMIRRKDMDDHIKNHCEKAIVNCRWYSQCNKTGERSWIKIHQNECEFRSIECEFCKAEAKPKEIEEHYSKCPEKEIECQSCRHPVTRKQIEEHLNNYCMKGKAECLFKQWGCKIEMLREELESHLIDKMKFHMQLMIEHANVIESEKEELKNQHEKMLDHLKFAENQAALLIKQNNELKENNQLLQRFKDKIVEENSQLISKNDNLSNGLTKLENANKKLFERLSLYERVENKELFKYSLNQSEFFTSKPQAFNQNSPQSPQQQYQKQHVVSQETVPYLLPLPQQDCFKFTGNKVEKITQNDQDASKRSIILFGNSFGTQKELKMQVRYPANNFCGIGACIKSVWQYNKCEWYCANVGHGCYIIGNDHWIFSHHDSTINQKQLNEWQIVSGDKFKISYEPKINEMVITKLKSFNEETKEKIILLLDYRVNNFDVFPCFILCGVGASVEILQQ